MDETTNNEEFDTSSTSQQDDSQMDSQTGSQAQEDNSSSSTASSDFSIPDEYKEKGWTRFFEGKSGDELKNEVFKSYDNQQSLIGKKVSEYLASTDLKSLDNYEEIKKTLIDQLNPEMKTPENVSDYALNDILKDENGNLQYEYPEEALDAFGNKFKELGLSKEQGQGLLKTYTDFEVEQFQKYTNADELESSITKMFNGNSEQRTTVEGLLKEFLPEQDQQFLQQTAPNYTIEMFYKVAQGLVSKYGFKENNSGGSNPTKMRMSDEDKNTEYNRLATELEALSNRPNKPGEKDAILTQMRNLFS